MNRISKAGVMLSLAMIIGATNVQAQLGQMGSATQPVLVSKPGSLNRAARAVRDLGNQLRDYADCRPNCSKKLLDSIKRNKKIIAGTVFAVGAAGGAYAMRRSMGNVVPRGLELGGTGAVGVIAKERQLINTVLFRAEQNYPDASQDFIATARLRSDKSVQEAYNKLPKSIQKSSKDAAIFVLNALGEKKRLRVVESLK